MDKSQQGAIEQIHTWVKRAQAGDIAAYESVYRELHRRLYLFCLRMTGQPASAEEVVQDAFVKAWTALPGFRFKSQFYTWLRQIAARLIIDELRCKGSQIWQNLVPLDERESARQQELGAAHDLEKLISALPQGARTVLVLFEIEGYTHVEISNMIGISQGTSKAQLFRARQLLKANISSLVDTPPQEKHHDASR